MLDEKQLALRRTGISGTDIGAICGLSEFRSPLDVWADKTGRAEPVDLTPAIKRGMYLESGILDWYAADSGALKVERCGTIQLAGQPRIMATPDGLALFGVAPVTGTDRRAFDVMAPHMARTPGPWERRGVEVKAPGPFMEYGWGEPGTDQVPQAYLAQAVFEMAVLDVERLDFAALLGGELRIFPVKRDRKVESLLVERALAFWRDHVEADKPPAPTWRERDADWLRRAFPKATKPPIHWDALTPEQRATVELYLEAHAAAGDAERRKLELELRTKMIVADAGGIIDLPRVEGVPHYTRIDWKENASAAPSWKKVAEALKDGASWEEALAAGAGSPVRPFVPRKSKKGDE